MEVLGIEETCQMLDQAPRLIVARGYFRALEASGQVFLDALWPLVPIDMKAALNKAHGGKGVIVGMLDSYIEIDSSFRGGSVDVGFGALGHIAMWNEYGHRMVGHKPDKKLLGEVPPHPFMRPAFDGSSDQAITAFAETLAGEVAQQYQQP